MMKVIFAAAMVASALFASSAGQAANCADVTFTSGPNDVTGWNPLTGSDGTSDFTVKATRVTTGSTVRSARIIFLDNQTGVTNLGISGPQYDIMDSGNNTVSAPLGTAVPTSSTGAQFNWGDPGSTDDSSASFSVRVLASASRDFVAGTPFSEALRYSVQCFDSDGSTLGSDVSVQTGNTLTLVVPSLLSIMTAGPYQVDFGSFTSATSSVNIGIKSTSSVNVAVATTNGSRMVAGPGPSYADNAVIPYTMQLNGVAISPEASSSIARAGVGGANWPLVLTLAEGAPVSGKMAGSYSDTITLTLTPGT